MTREEYEQELIKRANLVACSGMNAPTTKQIEVISHYMYGHDIGLDQLPLDFTAKYCWKLINGKFASFKDPLPAVQKPAPKVVYIGIKPDPEKTTKADVGLIQAQIAFMTEELVRLSKMVGDK